MKTYYFYSMFNNKFIKNNILYLNMTCFLILLVFYFFVSTFSFFYVFLCFCFCFSTWCFYFKYNLLILIEYMNTKFLVIQPDATKNFGYSIFIFINNLCIFNKKKRSCFSCRK